LATIAGSAARSASASPILSPPTSTGWTSSSPSAAPPPRQGPGIYRWHVQDPIRFKQDLRVTIQALGWRSALEGKRRYLPLQDDIASTAF
jgi:hypothetical protein